MRLILVHGTCLPMFHLCLKKIYFPHLLDLVLYLQSLHQAYLASVYAEVLVITGYYINVLTMMICLSVFPCILVNFYFLRLHY